MKYLVRAVKYYLYILILLVIILFALVKLNLANGDISTMFRDGYNSIWQIAALLAVFSAIYPKMGFGTRVLRIPEGDYSKEIKEYMDMRGYKLLEENVDELRFVFRSPITRLFKMFEDTITFSKDAHQTSIEGPTKDIVRIISGLENKINPLD